MNNTAENGTLKPARILRRLHWTSWAVIFLIAVGFFFVNFPARRFRAERRFIEYVAYIEHGWPSTYRVRLGEPYGDNTVWSFDVRDGEWRMGAFLLDVIFAAGVGAGIVAHWERRRRIRGSVWRFSLREALAALTLAAVVAGCWKANCDANQRLEEQLRGIINSDWSHPVELVADLPEWLRRSVGDENLRWFPVRELAGADDYGHPPFILSIATWDSKQPSDDIIKRIVEIVSSRPDFFGLDLGPKPSDAMIEIVRQVPMLRHVRTGSLNTLNSDLMTALSACSDLSTLEDDEWAIREPPLGQGDAEKLVQCRHLRCLVLDQRKVTEQFIAGLSALQELEYLQFRRSAIGRAGWEQIGSMRSLRRLVVPKCDLTDGDLASIARLPQLEELNVQDSPITDAGIDSLQNCSTLRFLSLDGTDIDDGAFELLARFPRLKHLSIANTHTNDRSLVQISRLAGLRILDITSTDVRHIDRLDCSAFPQLRSINITYCPIPRATITAWPSLYPTITLEERLDLGAKTPPAVLIFNNQTFADYINGDDAYLCATEVSDKVLRDFVDWAGRNKVVVRLISLSRSTVTDDGVSALAQLPGLTEVQLSRSDVTSTGIAKLSQLGGLETVELDARQLDDRSVKALQRLPHLKEVRLDGFRRFRDAEKAFNRFKDALPQLASPFDFDGPIPVVG